jgi:hypothetical protein
VSGPAISARERRTILLGAAVSLLALTLVFAVLPFVRHWRARESVLAAELSRVARLRAIVAAESKLHDAVAARETALESSPQRLIAGRTPALAASALQSLLQDFADQSQITVSRLDVAGAPDSAANALPAIPATVSAIGDIYGITDMLSRLHHGPRLLETVELTIRPNPALRGELLQMTVRLRAPYVTE